MVNDTVWCNGKSWTLKSNTPGYESQVTRCVSGAYFIELLPELSEIKKYRACAWCIAFAQ